METGSEEKEECPLQCCCNQHVFAPRKARPFVRLATRLDENFQGGYTPQQIRSAYDFPANSTGLGQTIALITTGLQPNIESDLSFFQQLFFFACSSFDNSADRCCPRGFRFGLGVGNDIGRRMGPCAGARGGSAIGLRRFGPNWGSDAGGRSGGGLGRGCDIHELGRAGAPRPIGAGTCFSPISIDSICRLCWRSVCRSIFSLHFRVGSFRRRHQSGFV